MKTALITLIGKPGCHLCDDARAVIDEVRAELSGRGIPTEFAELDILTDPELARLHSEDIPVVQIDGRRHAIHRVDPSRFSAAVERAARKRRLPFLSR
ncbi:glutaredoxin family protein [Leucobacter ruminantium]|uniref:Glutaredoxin family protein n=1 Tax=Leucobacter ruminantium TaxID=1289170 RepID=A0A939RZ04_9MICO|nr:glutaredoxin family protein [Leucobacter ruminantium]